MKIIRLVLPFIVFAGLFYVFYSYNEGYSNQLADSLFSAGLFTMIVYSLQFMRAGGLAYALSPFTSFRAKYAGSQQSLVEAEMRTKEAHNVTKAEDYTSYFQQNNKRGFPTVLIAYPIGIIASIISLFV